MFAVSNLSQFLTNPGVLHWEAAKHVFHCLLGTKGLTLTYGTNKHALIGYTDAGGASLSDSCAITGYIFCIDSGAVSWSSCKQELATYLLFVVYYICVCTMLQVSFPYLEIA